MKFVTLMDGPVEDTRVWKQAILSFDEKRHVALLFNVPRIDY